MRGEWKWWAELAVPFVIPVCCVAWCVWSERRLSRRVDELNAERREFEQWDHARLIEDREVAELDGIWELPTRASWGT